MYARTLWAVTALAIASGPALADDATSDVRAVLAPGGESVRLTMTSGGKAAGLSLAVGKAKPERLFKGEALGAVKVGHGKVVVAFAVDDNKTAFRIHVVGGTGSTLARPGKRADVPYAVVMTTTPSGFTVLFQDIEASNTNEAHTYMVELDKDGKPGEPREVQIPWALADMAWNGNGYHLALFYSQGNGVRLSMVTCDPKGTPQQHPDWASGPGLVSDVHLVADGKQVRAFYKGRMGDRMFESNVTKIREWGSEPPKAKDHGAISSAQAIAITAKGTATKLAAK